MIHGRCLNNKVKSVAVILGSAFQDSMPQALDLERIEVQTDWGPQALYYAKKHGKDQIVAYQDI